MNAWDRRSFVRALLAALLAVVVAWLVTAASDEGQLTMGVRAGRILPLVPLCSAAGAALAVGTSRARNETRTLETLGRAPARSTWTAVMGAALPSIVTAAVVALFASVDVSAFYPQPPRGDAFAFVDGAFESPSLGVRVDAEGQPLWLAAPSISAVDTLPHGARRAAAGVVAVAGLALALVVSRWATRASLVDRGTFRRRRRLLGIAVGVMVAATVVALQAAGARAVPASVAVLPALVLLFLGVLDVRSELARRS